jgi:hypothetical protein
VFITILHIFSELSPFAKVAFLVAFKMIHGLAETYKQLVDVATEIIVMIIRHCLSFKVCFQRGDTIVVLEITELNSREHYCISVL